MTYKQINGVIPILQTPFDNQGRIDTDGLRKVVEFNIEAGVDGIGIALASEVQLFNESERDELLSTVVDQTNRRVPVVMNTGAIGTDLAIYYSKRAEELGVDCVMLTPPNSGVGSSNPAAIRQYFHNITNAVNVSVALQDEQFQGFDSAGLVRGSCQWQVAERWQARKRTCPQRRLFEKVSTIWLVAHYVMVHHFFLVVVFTWAIRLT